MDRRINLFIGSMPGEPLRIDLIVARRIIVRRELLIGDGHVLLH